MARGLLRTYIEQGKAASPPADAGSAAVVVVVAMATACEAFGGRRRGLLSARSVVRLGRSAHGEREEGCARPLLWWAVDTRLSGRNAVGGIRLG